MIVNLSSPYIVTVAILAQCTQAWPNMSFAHECYRTDFKYQIFTSNAPWNQYKFTITNLSLKYAFHSNLVFGIILG